MKSSYSRDLRSLYNVTNKEIIAWADRHQQFSFVVQRLKSKVAAMMRTGQSMIDDWKTNTSVDVIEREWKTINDTAKRANDVTHAFFIVMESDMEDKDDVVDDLIRGKVSPLRYIDANAFAKKEASQANASVDEVVAALLSECAERVIAYKRDKETRKDIIISCQNSENQRHQAMKDMVAQWAASHPDYEDVSRWLECILDSCHSTVWGMISVYSLDEGQRDAECDAVERVIQEHEGKIKEITCVIEWYEQKKAADEEEKRKVEEEERLRIEAAKRKKADDSKRQKTEEVKETVLTVDTTDVELEGLEFDTIDTDKIDRMYVSGDKIYISTQLGDMVSSRGYNKASLAYLKGKTVICLAFGKAFPAMLDVDDKFRYNIESAGYAKAINDFFGKDGDVVEYHFETGEQKEYMYVKIYNS